MTPAKSQSRPTTSEDEGAMLNVRSGMLCTCLPITYSSGGRRSSTKYVNGGAVPAAVPTDRTPPELYIGGKPVQYISA